MSFRCGADRLGGNSYGMAQGDFRYPTVADRRTAADSVLDSLAVLSAELRPELISAYSLLGRQPIF